MAPKKAKTAKPTLKKKGTIAATVASGHEFLKRSWGEDGLQAVNVVLDARDQTNAAASKPKLSKTRTMQNTTKEAKELLGKEVLGDTRAETKRRQASAKAKSTPSKTNKKTTGKKPTLKRLGTMAKTANEGKAYIKRTGKANARKGAGGRKAKATK